MQIHRVRLLSIDGCRIGRTWSESFFETEVSALRYISTRLQEHNYREMSRNIPDKMSRLYDEEQSTIDGITGFACWQYGRMWVIDSVRVEV